MKDFVIAFLVLLVGIIWYCPSAQGQPEQPVYVQVSYMQVPPGESTQYVQMEQDIWKDIHAERLSQGLITGWSLYTVMFAQPEAAYQYITVNVYDDFAKLNQGYTEEILQAAHPDRSFQELTNQTSAARTIVHTEVWQLVDRVQPADPAEPRGQFLLLDFKSVPYGEGTTYETMEREKWKPAHQERISRDFMYRWELYSLMLPAGTVMPYNYATVNTFSSLDDVATFYDGATTDQLMRSVHSKASDAQIQAIYEQAGEIQTNHKRVLWQLIDSVPVTAE